MLSLRHVFVSACVVGLLGACGLPEDEDDGGGGGAGGGSGGAGGGGDDQCSGVACGEPCSTCTGDGPCAQESCDGLGTCREALDVTCPVCPDSPPPDGNACEIAGLFCEYDEGVVVACRTRSFCSPNGWMTASPLCESDPPADPACPEAQPSGGCTVGADADLCVYDATICGCTNCLGGPCGGPGQWVCAAAPGSPCPPVAPKLGEPCYVGAGTVCTYGSCAVNGTSGARVCQNGFWLDEPVPCPS